MAGIDAGSNPSTPTPAPLSNLLTNVLLSLDRALARLGQPELAGRARSLAQGAGEVRPTASPTGAALEACALARAARAILEARDAPHGTLAPLLDKAEAVCGATLREEARNRLFGLYVIIDPEVLRDRDPLAVAGAALSGGARLIQLRDKARDKGVSLPLARKLRELCEARNALFIVNDHADLAVACRADGLHVGQHDLPVAEARKVLSPRQIAGTSNATLSEGTSAWQAGVDYVAVGSIYPTSTKSVTRLAGVETLRRVKASVRAPVVAIGGINAGNVAPVVEAGADCVCVISAVTLAPDPEAAARAMVAAMRAAGGRA